MKPNHQIRNEALRALDGNWGTFVLMTLLYFFINIAVQAPFTIAELLQQLDLGANHRPSVTANLASIVINLLMIPIMWALSVTLLRNHRGHKVEITDLFCGYRRQFSRIIVTTLLSYIYFILWSLLLIIPGIIKAFSYALTPYILEDYPELSGDRAITLSSQMMNGRKLKLFMLCLSFIGWFILSCFTCGIGIFWLVPYIKASLAAFYEDAKADYEMAALNSIQ